MTMGAEGSVNPAGQALVDELLWVHGIIRSNLATIQSVIEQVIGGAPASQVRAQIDDLAATSVIWTLRVNCLRYCRLVHHHHGLEDAAFFPGLRRANPGLHSVIDKLQADHVVVSGYLDTVEAAAVRLGNDDTAREELASALHGLSEHLLTHLDFEEASLTPTLQRLNGWPF